MDRKWETANRGSAALESGRLRVLVGYSSAHGSTQEIARHVADRLAKITLVVDIAPMTSIADPSGYDAIVLGSAIHNSQWLPEAAVFTAQHEAVLRATPSWFFSVGTVGQTTSFLRPGWTRAARKRRKLPAAIATLVEQQTALTEHTTHTTHVDHHRWFAGVIEEGHWNAIGNLFLKLAGGEFGDQRDWDDIDAWTDRLATQIEYIHLCKTANAPG